LLGASGVPRRAHGSNCHDHHCLVSTSIPNYRRELTICGGEKVLQVSGIWQSRCRAATNEPYERTVWSMTSGRDVNRVVAKGFGGTLILTGIAGFLVPGQKAPTSGAPAYNMFHLVFGSVGIVASRHRAAARAFNVGFGAIDLYQALASRRGLFPQKWFRWKTADDVLHVVFGAGLVAVGLMRTTDSQ
jgi:hypothetical protein